MTASLRIYLALLLVTIVGWLWLRAPVIASFNQKVHFLTLFGITMLYLFSHILRIMRLVLLTLDERDKAFPLAAAHTLTAFPSSFLPFKIGEVLRLTGFFYVYEWRQKAFAIWLAERFGDVLVISTFIFGLYLFNVDIPASMRTILMLFVLFSAVGLLGLFAVAKVFVYLNRHLVLTSHTPRGLTLLRASHMLRSMELTIYKSVEGRLSGFILLSILIWVVEILALSFFINELAYTKSEFSELFISGLLASLPGGGLEVVFGLYQSFALITLALVFIVAVWLVEQYKILRP